jgi:hypothetical protein
LTGLIPAEASDSDSVCRAIEEEDDDAADSWALTYSTKKLDILALSLKFKFPRTSLIERYKRSAEELFAVTFKLTTKS